MFTYIGGTLIYVANSSESVAINATPEESYRFLRTLLECMTQDSARVVLCDKHTTWLSDTLVTYSREVFGIELVELHFNSTMYLIPINAKNIDNINKIITALQGMVSATGSAGSIQSIDPLSESTLQSLQALG